MSAVILDAGAFVAFERDDLRTIARLRAAQIDSHALRVPAIVVAQVWRSSRGRQARLARLLRAVDVVAVDLELAVAAGELLGISGTSDPIDATVVLVAQDGDDILTSDPVDIEKLVRALGVRVAVIPC